MSTTEEHRQREFYEAFDEYTANCGHQPNMYDMWLIARGVLYTDGHYVTWAQPQTTAVSEPAAPVDARDAETLLNALRDVLEAVDEPRAYRSAIIDGFAIKLAALTRQAATGEKT